LPGTDGDTVGHKQCDFATRAEKALFVRWEIALGVTVALASSRLSTLSDRFRSGSSLFHRDVWRLQCSDYVVRQGYLQTFFSFSRFDLF
jgi:hypothetical protein